ncbi:MAG TPA: type II secretion system protein [Thermodesulfovibrionales bacterium]|nr:type II secretion system protein [Thermodesulfovibrionales bacterium]
MKDEFRRMKDFLFNLQPSAFNLEFGFTLLEVMISLAVVGGLLVTLLYTLNYHLGIAERHRTVTISTELAKSKMYDMEKTPVAAKGAFPDPYSDYSYETSIRPSLMPGMSEIGVVVRSGKESITMSELIKKAK